MKLPVKLALVKQIRSEVARSTFSAEEIEQVARLMLEVEGTINPIILRRTGLDSYEVVEGHFEYYAAVRAQEISPLKGEMIQAVITEPNNEATILEQVKLLRGKPQLNPSPIVNGKGDFGELFKNLEYSLLSRFNQSDSKLRDHDKLFTDMTKQIETLKAEMENIVAKTVAAILDKTMVTQIIRLPINLNTATAKELEAVSGIGEKTAAKIIEERQKRGRFTSVDDLTEVSGLTKKKIAPMKLHLIVDELEKPAV